ncbi:MAG TPA: hypothetical protein VL614_15240 [Acetobacteraceae bacterium]|jgi:hypothetical protein|nr:hypothetical protein [Acetobacteraceae bacterium]
MSDKPLYQPWKRGEDMTTWVNVRVWSELDWQYHDLRWAIRNCDTPPVSNPPFAYVTSVKIY